MNKRGQETRKHIKKCACSLFAEKGFKEVTMKDICEVAKLSRGGLYCHYESTRQVFQEIVDDMTREQDNEIDLRIERMGWTDMNLMKWIFPQYSISLCFPIKG